MLFDHNECLRDQIKIQTHPDVWPPSLYGWQLATFISKLDCRNKRMVDIGCGSGIQAIVGAKCGAVASASDISDAAIDCTRRSARESEVKVHTRLGAGLAPWVGETFDLIICNGPTYEPVAEHEIRLEAEGQRLRPIPRVTLDIFRSHEMFLNPGGRIVGLFGGPYARAVAQAAAGDHGLRIECIWELNFSGSLEQYGGHFERLTAIRSGFAELKPNGTISIRAVVFAARRSFESDSA
jgi:SAM-dependent methyltransferase